MHLGKQKKPLQLEWHVTSTSKTKIVKRKCVSRVADDSLFVSWANFSLLTNIDSRWHDKAGLPCHCEIHTFAFNLWMVAQWSHHLLCFAALTNISLPINHVVAVCVSVCRKLKLKVLQFHIDVALWWQFFMFVCDVFLNLAHVLNELKFLFCSDHDTICQQPQTLFLHATSCFQFFSACGCCFFFLCDSLKLCVSLMRHFIFQPLVHCSWQHC